MAPSRLRRTLAVAGMALLLVTTLDGCGRRGRLEPPVDPSAPPQAKADATKSGIPRRPKNPPIQPPKEPFVLDPLL